MTNNLPVVVVDPRRNALRPLKSVAFDLAGWHWGPGCSRTFISGVGGIGVKVCCGPCGKLCDVEALGTRITIEESFHMREG